MFTNTGSSVHDLVIVVAFMGALFSGYAGMTIWAHKGGKPAGGSSSAACWGPWVYSSSPQPPRARQKSTAPRDPRGSPRVPTARSASKARRGCAGTVSVTSGPCRRTVIAGPKVRHQSAQATTGTQVRRAIAAGAGPAARRG